ncbi:Fe2+-dependent dioxygenase [Aquisalinus flavus]|uniref:PKHD-type hydroxylase n=1 Tax=Aquisalinus flavus TaxID=1526572 RepID=A0A8J2V352_9PROT|nr:Fe2+-dependent dioxygenase [Aquisalinus flavus]MBD0426043.1 Fe2+-dependent dioxygenase [Aquisalinus flavus]UNE48367.1 Fe2+-dependent dioxygenase [Aquisalinus flavus]GGD11168.1 PKHD-type hydroxylase [Aquisalinus flavus]
MLITISSLLNQTELAETRDALETVEWSDGAKTAGRTARNVKQNRQADLSGSRGQALHELLLRKISGHPVLQAAARPAKFSRLLISETADHGGYGDHTDNALMGRGAARIRTDLSFTLFLSEPARYEGGELVIDMPGYTQAVKPDAGDLVLYPSGTIHQVAPVTKGTRIACVGWLQSLIRDAACREILFDMENLRASLRASLPQGSRELLTLDKSIANLVRLWAET